MVKYVFFMLLITIIVSCNNEYKGNNIKICDDISPNIEINNSKLKEELVNFLENNKGDSDIIRLTHQRRTDTIIYEISYINAAIDIMPSKILPIHSWFSLDQYIVCVTFDFNDNFITMNESTALKLIKQKLPDDYQYYIENKTFPIPNTELKKILKLTFVNDKMIKKEFYKG